MELRTMGRVVVSARVENLGDLYLADRGKLDRGQVRVIEITDALVDTGATFLSLPRILVQELGLKRVRTRSAKTSAGIFEFGMYEAVRLTIQGRECVIEVAEVPDQCPALVGQIPLEMMDWVVDPVNQRLIGNPEHGGEQMMDML